MMVKNRLIILLIVFILTDITFTQLGESLHSKCKKFGTGFNSTGCDISYNVAVVAFTTGDTNYCGSY